MKHLLKKKLLIFDLDGALIDSKSNMKFSWKKVQYFFNLKDIDFEKYFSQIGKPFKEILNELNIKNNHYKIKKCYDKYSILNLGLIKFYPKTLKTLKKLKKEGFLLCIVTSKDKKRTKLILKKHLNLFKIIQCPQYNLKGKPHSDQINRIIKKLNIKKNKCIYIGDTHVDYLTAKNSKIDFLFSEWGYSKKLKIFINSIKKLEEINKKIKLAN